MNSIVIAILAGGESRRMGQDKGLMSVPLRPAEERKSAPSSSTARLAMVCLLLKRLQIWRRISQRNTVCGSNIVEPILISIREEQWPAYKAQIPAALPQPIPVFDSTSASGPLQGLLSLQSWVQKEWPGADGLLALSVDMPWIRIRTIHRLIQLAESTGKGIFYNKSARLEPIPGVYPGSLLEAWANSVKSNPARIENALHRRLRDDAIQSIGLPESEHRFFSNLNYPNFD